MAKQKNYNTDEIRKQLLDHPFEDVYSVFFAEKELNSESLKIFIESFNHEYFVNDQYKFIKLKHFVEWIEQNYEEYELEEFPTFIEYYIHIMYRENGLKSYSDVSGNILVLENEPGPLEVYSRLVHEYEERLIGKKWWTDLDSIQWIEFQQQRREVENFEDYIYMLEDDITNPGTPFEDEINFRTHLPIMYKKNLDRIRLEIAEIRLFKRDLLKIPMLENLIEYISALEKEDEYYAFLFKKTFKKEGRNEIENIPINIEGQEKFIYCSKLGIVEYLKERITLSGLKYTDSKLYPLISLITGNNIASVKKLMSFHNNPDNISEENPFKDNELMERVNRFLINNNLIKTGD